MRRILVVILGSAALFAPAAGAAAPPSVSFVHYSPLQVSGKGFAHARLVHVRVTWTGGAVAKDVRTSSLGAFTVKWPLSVRPHVCQRLVVTATVAKTLVKVVTRPPIEMCGGVPPPGPPKN
jgi:hypothetical protein